MHVYERHQLNNPDMELMMQIVRDFSRKNLTMNPDDDTSPQKKMNRVGHVPPREYTRQNVNVPVTYLFRIAQAANPNQNLNFLFPLHVRRKYLGIVTLISRMHAKN
jgi:hypothetical protein